MNVATGTFGSGIPILCPHCDMRLEYETISDGWNAKEDEVK